MLAIRVPPALKILLVTVLLTASANANDACYSNNKLDLRVDVGHNGVVDALALSPDERLLASGSWDATVRLWEVRTGEAICVLENYRDTIGAVAFSPDGRYIATGGSNGVARLWSVHGRFIRILATHQSPINAISFSPDGRRIATGSGYNPPAVDRDDSVIISSVSTGHPLRRIAPSMGAVTEVFFTPDGTRVIATSLDGFVRVWNSKTGTELAKFGDPTRWIVGASLSADGTKILTASNSGSAERAPFVPGAMEPRPTTDFEAELWDIESKREIRRFLGHSDLLRSVALSADGSEAAGSSYDGTILLWNATTGSELRQFKSPAVVYALLFSRGGRALLGGDQNGAIHVWETSTARSLGEYTGMVVGNSSVAVSPDGEWIVSGCGNGAVGLWNVSAGTEATASVTHEGVVSSVAVSRDSRTFVVGGGSGIVPSRARSEPSTGFAEVWDVRTLSLVRRFGDYEAAVMSVGLSSDGQLAAIGTDNGFAYVYEASNGRLAQTIRIPGLRILAVALSDDGKTLLVGSSDNCASLWDVASGHLIWQSCGLRFVNNGIGGAFFPAVNVVMFAKDEKQVYVGDDLGLLRTLSTDSGHLELPPFRFPSRIGALAATADGRSLVVGLGDGSVAEFSLKERTVAKWFRGHTAAIGGVAILGSHILSASADGTTRIWEENASTPLATLIVFLDGRYAVVSPNGWFDMPDAGAGTQ